ncbi:MAG: FCD domain-containing protein [Anaerolineales bacterium]|nr:FCD domain-containing protein [Anaerolineales bacterium]
MNIMNESGQTDGTWKSELPATFLQYLADSPAAAGERLPSIHEISAHLGISSGKLREQLEVARQLGLVDVRPKTGIRRLPFSFLPSLRLTLNHALAIDPAYFEQFGDLRNALEVVFWKAAAQSLLPEDRQTLRRLVERAWEKLGGEPIQIPHAEHRALHLTIFSRFENTFVRGVLEMYWEAYEAFGLNVYADYAYLKRVWEYHERMVDAILAEEYELGYQIQIEHASLLHERPELHRLRWQGPTAALEAGATPREAE